VVADPWAHVVVDGEHIDTTPFARPIPLSAGVHHVRLEHPAAPTERRTVTLAAGETVLLDVKMAVAPSASAPSVAPAAGPEEPATP
jgi:serine/threonine-protein kinase